MNDEKRENDDAKEEIQEKNDFTKGSVASNIMKMAVPMMVAQVVNVLYSVVDRMYIGRLEDVGVLALTGVGVAFPVTNIVTAFANLCGAGGAPLCSIARGRGDLDGAKRIMGNAFTLLLGLSVILTASILIFKEPLLYAFGASNGTFPFANAYLTIYISGSIFVMTGLGMNQFINAQGFGKIGMITVCIGAAFNIILDPIFIFVLDMGVQGAATATIISQFISAVWVLWFLTGKKAIFRLDIHYMRLKLKTVGRIVALGLSNFTMALTGSLVSIACNRTLQTFGGDLYVAVMTVINSVREVVAMPMSGIAGGSLPVISYNYGAHDYARVRQGIKFMTKVCLIYTVSASVLLLAFPELVIKVFNSDAELLAVGSSALRIYFCFFSFMALQISAQNTFVSLGKSRQAIFFSLLRKVIIVVPLTLILPYVGNLGANGVFMAEPVSDIVGGTVCFTTMMLTIYRRLKKDQENV